MSRRKKRAHQMAAAAGSTGNGMTKTAGALVESIKVTTANGSSALPKLPTDVKFRVPPSPAEKMLVRPDVLSLTKLQHFLNWGQWPQFLAYLETKVTFALELGMISATTLSLLLEKGLSFQEISNITHVMAAFQMNWKSYFLDSGVVFVENDDWSVSDDAALTVRLAEINDAYRAVCLKNDDGTGPQALLNRLVTYLNTVSSKAPETYELAVAREQTKIVTVVEGDQPVLGVQPTVVPTEIDTAGVAEVPEVVIPNLFAGGGAIVEPLLVARIRPDPKQPRTEFDPVKLTSLGKFLKQRQITPIVVRKIEGDLDHDYQLIAGERRWRAAQAEGLETLYGIVNDGEMDPRELYLLMFFDNMHREPYSEMDEARAFWHILVVEKMMSRRVLAERLGVSDSYISNRLKLLQLDFAVQAMVDTGRLQTSVATMLAHRVPDPALQNEIAREIVGENIGSAEAGPYIRQRVQAAGKALGGRKQKPVDDYRLLLSVLTIFEAKLGGFQRMKPQEIVAMFTHRNPKDAQVVVARIQEIMDQLGKIAGFLNSSASKKKAASGVVD